MQTTIELTARSLHSVPPEKRIRRELQALLELASAMPPDELPELLGDLERIRVTAFVRLTARRTDTQHDELLSVDEAAAKLNVSKDYIYRNHAKFPFTRREGRKLLFSSLGLNSYMQKQCA